MDEELSGSSSLQFPRPDLGGRSALGLFVTMAPSSGSGMTVYPLESSRLLSAQLLLRKKASQIAGSGTPHHRSREEKGDAHSENRAFGSFPTTSVGLFYISLVWCGIGFHPHASGCLTLCLLDERRVLDAVKALCLCSDGFDRNVHWGFSITSQ